MTIKNNISSLNSLRISLFLELENANRSWFVSKSKVKKIENQIKVLDDSIESLEELLVTLAASEVHFKTLKVDFPQAKKITRLGLYLTSRQLTGEEWVHSYKIES